MARHDRLQGTLDLLVLKCLVGGPRHGYGITTHIQTTSEGVLQVEEGSLYPALHRMEREGWIEADWQKTDFGRRAKFYSLTSDGRQQLDAEREKWRRLSAAVELVWARS